MAKLPIAVQLYTLRNECEADFRGTVEKVAKIGYKGVELAGNTGGMGAKELKTFLDNLGLKVAGSHVGIDMLTKDLDAAMDFAKEVGNKWIVCPYLSEEWRQDAAAWASVGATLNKIGKKCKTEGLQLCYHNHSFEFQKYDGKYGMEILYGSADADLLKAELDTYWVKHGGEDPAEYVRKFAGRLPLLHCKDMAKDEKKSFAEVGEGTLDWPEIFKAADQAGVEWYIVEQDICPRPPLESIAISFNNLKNMGRA